jgi:hypothetical protein
MPTPITVSVNFIDLTGNAFTGYMQAAVVSPTGVYDLYVAGTGIIAPKLITSGQGTTVSVSIWGNDVIVDAADGAKDTYYTVNLFNASNVLVWTAAYLFTGAGPINLVGFPILNPVPAPSAPSFPVVQPPGGPNQSIQFNNAGVFAGDAQLTWDTANKFLKVGLPASSFDTQSNIFLDNQFDGFYSFRSLNNSGTRVVTLNALNETNLVGDVGGGIATLQGLLTLTNTTSASTAGYYSGFLATYVNGTGAFPSGLVGCLGAQTQILTNVNVFEIATLDADFAHEGTATLTNGSVVRAGFSSANTGTITKGACFKATGVGNFGGGIVTNAYSFYSTSLPTAGVTNSYAFFSEDQTTAANQFVLYSAGGLSQLNSLTAANVLQLNNATAATVSVSQSSPSFTFQSNFWNGASTVNGFTIQSVASNGLNQGATLQFSYQGRGSGGQTGGYHFDDAVSCSAINPTSIGIANGNFDAVVLVLTSASNAAGGKTTYAGTFTGQNFPQPGMTTVVAGFVNGGNNGTFEVFSCSSSSLVLLNSGGVAETHAGTATTVNPQTTGGIVNLLNPGSGTLSIQGTSFAVNTDIVATPLSLGLVIQQQGDAKDLGFLSAYSNTDTSRGFRVGASYDGTGVNPGLLQWGFNASAGHVMNLLMPDGITGLAATGTLFTSSSVGTVALQASTGSGTASLSISGTTGSATFTGKAIATNLIANAATPTGSAGQLSLGTTAGFGNGSSGQAVTTTAKNTGSGPTTATTVVNYLEIDIAGTKYWVPLMQ